MSYPTHQLSWHNLLGEKRAFAVTAEWPPLWKASALSSLHIGYFLAVCALSYLRLPFGSSIIAALLVLAALADLTSGLLLVLIAVVFQYLFMLLPGDFYHIVGPLSVAYMIRALPVTLREGRRFTAQWLVLGFFIALVFLHLYPAIDFKKDLTAIGFLFLAATIFLHIRNMTDGPQIATVIATVCLSGLIAGIMSFAYLYLPFPALFLAHSPNALLDVRLMGAQDNANGMAERLLPACVALLSLVFLNLPPRLFWILSLTLAGVLVAATGTKSLMLGWLVIAAALSIVAARHKCFKCWCGAAALPAVAILAFLVATLPILQAHAARAWLKRGEFSMNAASYERLARKSVLETLAFDMFARTLRRELRVAGPVEEPKIINGRTRWIEEPPAKNDTFVQRLYNTGERFRLLRVGLRVILDHPWWGIGHKEWPVVMQRRIGYPFLSPHNGFLETWGAYGILGALLYLAVIILVARNYWTIETHEKRSSPLWISRGIAFFFLATLLREMVDVSSVLAVTPIALWGWAALGVQEGMALQCSSLPKAAPALDQYCS